MITLNELISLAKPIPRYTSYPTAPVWGELDQGAVRERYRQLGNCDTPISLYFHVPFCKTMCLYCGCSVVLNRKKENEVRYVDALIQEIDLVTKHIGKNRRVLQLHFGGGTPTQLDAEQLQRLMEAIRSSFSFTDSDEIAIEIDPRTVCEDQGQKLKFIKSLGFNRVSFGVQDTDPKVQEAVRRRQSYSMTLETFKLARELGFKGINIDLIYGLPYQTKETFKDAVEKIAAMRPDRIALFSYAKVPWLKPHQNAIKESTLPSLEEKFKIYLMAREHFLSHGYTGLGMDHFALESDELSQAYLKGALHRNFQGYTTQPSDDLVAFGVTGIGFFQNAYFQNVKDLETYYASVEAGRIPVSKGKILTLDDRIRRDLINTLMCHFEVDIAAFEAKWHLNFSDYFRDSLSELRHCVDLGLIKVTPAHLLSTEKGKLFLRNCAACFDAYLPKDVKRKFSSAV